VDNGDQFPAPIFSSAARSSPGPIVPCSRPSLSHDRAPRPRSVMAALYDPSEIVVRANLNNTPILLERRTNLPCRNNRPVFCLLFPCPVLGLPVPKSCQLWSPSVKPPSRCPTDLNSVLCRSIWPVLPLMPVKVVPTRATKFGDSRMFPSLFRRKDRRFFWKLSGQWRNFGTTIRPMWSTPACPSGPKNLTPRAAQRSGNYELRRHQSNGGLHRRKADIVRRWPTVRSPFAVSRPSPLIPAA